MSFFSAVKKNQFAANLFASVGFKFEDAFKANDEKALKAFVDGAVATKSGATDEQQSLIAEALAENEKLTRSLETATNNAKANAETTKTILAGFGLQLPDLLDKDSVFSAEKFEAAHKLAIAKASRIELAKHGIVALEEVPDADPTAKKGAKSATITEFNAMTPFARMAFVKAGGTIAP